MRSTSLTVTALALLACCSWLGAASAPAEARPTSPGSSLYDTIVQQYMSGKWDELEETLKTSARELNALAAPQKLDITYIRQNLAESRPLWWKQVKSASGKVNFRPTLWGRTLDMAFDPAGKGGVQTQYRNNRMEIAVSWPAGEMDNPAHAEHGFSKGELNNLSVFATLGMAAMWAGIPPQDLVNLTEDQKTQLSRAFDFASNVTGVYYGSPRARQWGLWLYMHSYLEKYQKMPTVNGRKALASCFLIEVLSNPKKYPSIALPAKLDADNAEEKLALAVHQPIEKKGWTLAEDRSIREAIKALAVANPAVLRAGGKITLPAGLFLSLDPDQDAPLRARRDAWFKKQFDKVKGG